MTVPIYSLLDQLGVKDIVIKDERDLEAVRVELDKLIEQEKKKGA